MKSNGYLWGGPLGFWNRGTRRENQAGRDCNEFIEIKVETTLVITVNLSTLPGSIVKHASAAHLHVDFCNL